MKVVFHDRTESGAGGLRHQADQRLQRMARHFDRILEAEVVIEPESRARDGVDAAWRAAIRLHVDGRRRPPLTADEQAHDPVAALDLALDKLEHQLLKLKERIVDRHRGRPRPVARPAGEFALTLTGGEPERVKLAVRPETIADAVAALENGDDSVHLFLDEGTGAVNVLYRRPDATLVLIEPLIK